MILRYLHNSLSGLRINELLHLKTALLNSSLENDVYVIIVLFEISSNNFELIWWLWAELNNKWSTCQRSSSSRQGQPLCLMASIAGNLHFLIQFMSSQEPFLFAMVSWILTSKNTHLVFFVIFLNFPQFSTFLKAL